MGAPIDVLAVMDAVLAFAARGVESDDPAREMIESGYEARAAVAELIEAVAEQMEALDAPQQKFGSDALALQRADNRVRAALARVNGVQP